MNPMRILLVDDEERFLTTTAKLLTRRGHRPLTAESGLRALEVLEKEHVDVVILDVKMPEMDGMTALRRIRAAYPQIEVIMLTGHGTIESAVSGLKSGAFDYLTKPCDIDDLIDKAGEAFERRLRLEEKIREAQVQLAMRSPRGLVRKIDEEKDD